MAYRVLLLPVSNFRGLPRQSLGGDKLSKCSSRTYSRGNHRLQTSCLFRPLTRASDWRKLRLESCAPNEAWCFLQGARVRVSDRVRNSQPPDRPAERRVVGGRILKTRPISLDPGVFCTSLPLS